MCTPKDGYWPSSLKTNLYAATTGRFFTFPEPPRAAPEDVQIAIGELVKANDRVSKFSPMWVMKKESDVARQEREKNGREALEALHALQRSSLPVVAKAALLFYEAAFPDETFSISRLKGLAEEQGPARNLPPPS